MKIYKIDLPIFIWCLLLVIFYFADGVDKFSRAAEGGRVAFVFRMLAIAGMLFYIIYNPKVFFSKNRYVYFLLLILVTALGYIFSGLLNNNNISQSFYICIRYLSFIIFLFFLLCCVDYERKNNKYHYYIAKTIVFIFIFNCIISWVGYVLNIDIFRTYGHIADLKAGWVDQRFGYDGLLLEQNNATYFYIVGFITTYWLYIQKKINILWLIVGFTSCFIVGTKSLYAAIIFMSILIFIKGARVRIILFLVSLIMISTLLIFYTSVIDKINYQMLNQALSGRFTLFENHVEPILSKLTIFQLLLGFQGGDPKQYLVEMEFVDLIVFFGFLGAGLYLFIFFKELVIILSSTRLKMAKETIIIILVVSFFSGHLLYDPVSSFYFSSLILCIATYTKTTSET